MQHPRDLARAKIPNLRLPQAEDGAAIWDLVQSCKPLDENSMYCNMIQCDHFAVSEAARGSGLGALMLQAISNREVCDDVTRIQTTITADNEASWALFRKFGKTQGSKLDAEAYYTQEVHFQDQHKTEHLVTIPLAKAMAQAA